jgi:hypothetical protein
MSEASRRIRPAPTGPGARVRRELAGARGRRDRRGLDGFAILSLGAPRPHAARPVTLDLLAAFRLRPAAPLHLLVPPGFHLLVPLGLHSAAALGLHRFRPVESNAPGSPWSSPLDAPLERSQVKPLPRGPGSNTRRPPSPRSPEPPPPSRPLAHIPVRHRAVGRRTGPAGRRRRLGIDRPRTWRLLAAAAARRDQETGGEQNGQPSHVSPSHPAQQRPDAARPPPVHAG